MADEDLGPAAEKAKRELKGDIDYEFVLFDDMPRAFLEQLDGLYVQPKMTLVGGVTSGDAPGIARIDSSGRLDVVSSPFAIGSGTIRLVSGEFTKNATGAIGTVIVTPGVDDVVYFLYGLVTIGATHAGAASPLYGGISGSNASAGLLQSHLQDATADADEVFRFPGLGAATTGATTTSGVYHSLQTAIIGANRVNLEPGTAAIIGNPRYIIEYNTMTDTETFEASLYFLSITNTAVTVTTVEGTWA